MCLRSLQRGQKLQLQCHIHQIDIESSVSVASTVGIFLSHLTSRWANSCSISAYQCYSPSYILQYAAHDTDAKWIGLGASRVSARFLLLHNLAIIDVCRLTTASASVHSVLVPPITPLKPSSKLMLWSSNSFISIGSFVLIAFNFEMASLMQHRILINPTSL